MQKKVAGKKLIGFSQEALDELAKKKKAAGSGATETGILEDLILGNVKFSPFIEAAIKLQQEYHGISRQQAIDFFLTKGITSLITVEKPSDEPTLSALKNADEETLKKVKLKPIEEKRKGNKKP